MTQNGMAAPVSPAPVSSAPAIRPDCIPHVGSWSPLRAGPEECQTRNVAFRSVIGERSPPQVAKKPPATSRDGSLHLLTYRSTVDVWLRRLWCTFTTSRGQAPACCGNIRQLSINRLRLGVAGDRASH